MMPVQDSTLIESFDLGPLLEPEAIGFSFQSPGWYILGAFLFLLAMYLFIKQLRFYVQNAYRREALKNLSAIEAGFGQQDGKKSLRDAMLLLKLVALQAFGREKVASLYGKDWLDFLEEKGKDTPFPNYTTSISASLYRSEDIGKDEIESLIGLCKRWIKTHA